jgi:hypothetical protein
VDGPPKDPCAGITQIRFNGCDLRLPTRADQPSPLVEPPHF